MRNFIDNYAEFENSAVRSNGALLPADQKPAIRPPKKSGAWVYVVGMAAFSIVWRGLGSGSSADHQQHTHRRNRRNVIAAAGFSLWPFLVFIPLALRERGWPNPVYLKKLPCRTWVFLFGGTQRSHG